MAALGPSEGQAAELSSLRIPAQFSSPFSTTYCQFDCTKKPPALETGGKTVFGPEGMEAYAAKVEEWRDRLARDAAACGVDYVPVDTSAPFGTALASYLARRAGH